MKKICIPFVILLLMPGVLLAESSNIFNIPGLTAREVRYVMRAKKRNPNIETIAEQCGNVRNVNFLIKADTSHHISPSDPRHGSYSVIGSSQNCRPCNGLCPILFSDGTKAGSVGYYGVWSRSHGGNGCNRYYGGAGGAPRHSANAIIRKARGAKGPNLYLKSGRTCYRWTASSRRVGST